jgi:hypothetical protein
VQVFRDSDLVDLGPAAALKREGIFEVAPAVRESPILGMFREGLELEPIAAVVQTQEADKRPWTGRLLVKRDGLVKWMASHMSPGGIVRPCSSYIHMICTGLKEIRTHTHTEAAIGDPLSLF